MHTTNLGEGWVAHHNGDYSGDVQLANANNKVNVEISFKLLQMLVMNKVRSDMIRELEDATAMELVTITQARILTR